MSGNAELVTFFVFAVPLLFAAAGVVTARSPVYAGAVMVLFLFVIMLLSIHEDDGGLHKPRVIQWLGAAGALGLFALMIAAVWNVSGGDLRSVPADFGTVKAVGNVLYTQYLLPFEATSILLLVAIVGAVVVAKEKI